MRFTRFITSGGETPGMTANGSAHGSLGLVLIGLDEAASAEAAIRYTDLGCDVAGVAIDPASSLDAHLARVAAALEAVRAPGGRAGVAGYGDGGRYAFLAATRLGADVALAFAGRGIGAHLDESKFARVPMSLHFGDDDPLVPPAEVRKIASALQGIGVIDIYRYPAFDAAALVQAERRAGLVLEEIRRSAG
jgi:dienelactone hydrolase